MSRSNSSAVAFRIALVGSILFVSVALTSGLLAALAVISLWIVTVMFVLPCIALCYYRCDVSLPTWTHAFRDPHQ